MNPLSLADYPPKLLAWVQENGWHFVDERTGFVASAEVAVR